MPRKTKQTKQTSGLRRRGFGLEEPRLRRAVLPLWLPQTSKVQAELLELFFLRCQPGACGGEFHLTCKEPGSCDDRGRGAHGAARDPRIVEVDVEFAQSHQRERQRLDWTSDPSSAGADHVQVYAMECWVEVVPVPLALHLVVRDVVIRRGVASDQPSGQRPARSTCPWSGGTGPNPT